MKYILHRVNRISSLSKMNPNWGCEIDLRSDVARPNEIHLSHDPWNKGDSFKNWLGAYKACKISGPIILNTKEDGLESQVLALMNEYDIKDYFFLDTTNPTLVKWAIRSNNPHFSVRVSKYEDLSLASHFIGKIDWVWLDCFDLEFPENEIIMNLKNNFKICLVSPELQGAKEDQIAHYKNLFPLVDAICTKYVDAWKP